MTEMEKDMREVIYRHTPDMGEISGFGGWHEACCQDMLEAGVKWLSQRPDAQLEGSTFKQIFGVLTAESDDAKDMERAVLSAAKGERTGAMHHYVMSRLFWISKNGWQAYCEELRKREREGA